MSYYIDAKTTFQVKNPNGAVVKEFPTESEAEKYIKSLTRWYIETFSDGSMTLEDRKTGRTLMAFKKGETKEAELAAKVANLVNP